MPQFYNIHYSLYLLLRAFLEEKGEGAFLIYGEIGRGSFALVHHLLKYFYCNGKSKPCEKCPSCRDVNQLIHLDILLLLPELNALLEENLYEKAKSLLLSEPYLELEDLTNEIYAKFKKSTPQIGVKDISIMQDFIQRKPIHGKARTVILWDADLMNTASANKILKILEDPIVPSIFLFIASSQDNILPTVASRCIRIKVPPVDYHSIAQILNETCKTPFEEAIQIAQMSNGNINNAIKLAKANINEKIMKFREIMTLAYKKNFFEVPSFVESVSSNLQEVKNIISTGILVIERVIKAMLINEEPKFFSPPVNKFIKGLSNTLTINQIIEIYKLLEITYQNLNRNINPRLLLSSLIFDVSQIFKSHN